MSSETKGEVKARGFILDTVGAALQDALVKTRKPLVIGMIVGAVLTTAPVLGMVGMAHGLTRASHALQQSGVDDPRRVAAGVGEMLMATAAGLVLLIVGVLLFAGCLIAFLIQGNRAPAPNVPPLGPR